MKKLLLLIVASLVLAQASCVSKAPVSPLQADRIENLKHPTYLY